MSWLSFEEISARVGLNPTYIKSIIKNDQKLTLVSYKKRDKLMCINDACFFLSNMKEMTL